jgi:hypothetical protein
VKPPPRTTLDPVIESIIVDAANDREKLSAFRQALEDHIKVPCDAFVIGEPVSVIEFDYDGNVRRGLTARCRRQDGAEYVVAAADVGASSTHRRRTIPGHVPQMAGPRVKATRGRVPALRS